MTQPASEVSVNSRNLSPVAKQALAAMDRLPPQSLALKPAKRKRRHYSISKTVSLLSSLRSSVENVGTPVFYVVGARMEQASSEVAFELARAATGGGRKVLFIETGELAQSQFFSRTDVKVSSTTGPQPLDVFLSLEEPQSSPFWHIEGSLLYVASMREAGVLPEETLLAMMQHLRSLFDVVIMHSSNALISAAPSVYSSLSDGVVVVAEAERTREPVVEELARKISAAGGKLVGGVMTGRRFYVPRMVYRLMFGGR